MLWCKTDARKAESMQVNTTAGNIIELKGSGAVLSTLCLRWTWFWPFFYVELIQNLDLTEKSILGWSPFKDKRSGGWPSLRGCSFRGPGDQKSNYDYSWMVVFAPCLLHSFWTVCPAVHLSGVDYVETLEASSWMEAAHPSCLLGLWFSIAVTLLSWGCSLMCWFVFVSTFWCGAKWWMWLCCSILTTRALCCTELVPRNKQSKSWRELIFQALPWRLPRQCVVSLAAT